MECCGWSYSGTLFDGYDQFFELAYERGSPRSRFNLIKGSPARLLVLLLSILRDSRDGRIETA